MHTGIRKRYDVLGTDRVHSLAVIEVTNPSLAFKLQASLCCHALDDSSRYGVVVPT